MPTIDQLSPASAATDSDQILVSQNGTARKLTRAQMLDGTQPEIALPARHLLGRHSTGMGAPEPLALGPGLAMTDGALSLAATGDFDISTLPAGTVPTGADFVPLGQNGGNVAVTYAQFLSGLPNVPNVSASNMTVKATGSTATQKMADFAANTLPKSGGQMSGPLVLAAAPFLANQATTKAYTDAGDAARVAKAGDTMTGPLVLQADPVATLGAATKQYVDSGDAARVAKSGDAMTGPLFTPQLSTFQWGYGMTDTPVKMQVAGSTTGTPGVLEISQQTTHGGGPDAAVRPTLGVATTVGNEVINGTLTGPSDNRWASGMAIYSTALRGPGTSGGHAQHGVAYNHVNRFPLEGGFPAGQEGAPLWNTWHVINDSTNEVSSRAGALVGLEHDISANNRDDALARFQRQVVLTAAIPQSQGGLPMEWAYGDYWNSVTGADRDSFFRAVIAIYAGYTDAGIDFAYGTGERANPYVDEVNRAAAIRMRAGQRIAFDGDGATGKVLSYDGTAHEFQYRAGGAAVFRIADNGRLLSGAGITLGGTVTVSGTTALAANSTNMGALIRCTGAGSAYTVTLPAAASVPAGVGLTFSVTGTGKVTLAAAAGNSFQSGAPTLVQHDRLHLVSDGVSQWQEVFRTNMANAHFTGPPVLPNYTVAALPTGMDRGAKAFATNGRKTGEAAGAGTGVEVFFDGTSWISVISGTAITA